MEPSVSLVQPFIDPPNTFRARNIDETYSVATSIPILNFSYEIGIPSTTSFAVAIRNNTVSHNLRVDHILPSFLKTSVLAINTIAPGEIFKFDVTLDDADIKQRIFTGTLRHTDKMYFNVRPLGVAGPVFIARNLTALTV